MRSSVVRCNLTSLIVRVADASLEAGGLPSLLRWLARGGSVADMHNIIF
jgi:hypothetical protein